MRSFVVAALMVGCLAMLAAITAACGDYANTVRSDVFVPNASGPNPNNLPNANGVPKPGLPGGHTVVLTSVIISEVLVDAPGPNSGAQYVELHNTGPGDADIGGWVISNGGSAFSFPYGFRLGDGARVVVHLGISGADSNTDLYAPSFNELGDNGSLALLRGGNDIVGFVQWGAVGQPYEGAAVAAGVWISAGYTLAVPAEGSSLNQDGAGWHPGPMSPGN